MSKQPDSGNPEDPKPNVEFDPSKLSDEQIQKVLEDPRVWKTPRLKDLREKAKKADQYEEDKQKQEEEAAKQRGEWEKLAKQKEEEAQKAKEQLNNALIQNAIIAEAQKQGVKDIELVQKLIDSGSVKVLEDGKVEGVSEQVGQIVQARPYLKAATPTNTDMPGGDAPANPGGKIKLSDMNNAQYYQKHEKEIAEAIKTGNIDYDN